MLIKDVITKIIIITLFHKKHCTTVTEIFAILSFYIQYPFILFYVLPSSITVTGSASCACSSSTAKSCGCANATAKEIATNIASD